MENRIDLLDKIKEVIEKSKSAKAKKVEARKAILSERKTNSIKSVGIVIGKGNTNLVAVIPTGMTATKLNSAKEKFAEEINEFKLSDKEFLRL